MNTAFSDLSLFFKGKTSVRQLYRRRPRSRSNNNPIIFALTLYHLQSLLSIRMSSIYTTHTNTTLYFLTVVFFLYKLVGLNYNNIVFLDL